MIARIWHGWTPAEQAETYAGYVKKTGVRDQTSIEGNRGDFLLRRIEDGRAHFIVISLWDSMDAVRRFAPDPDQPIYYPQDEDYLLELTPDVEHYEILVSPGRP